MKKNWRELYDQIPAERRTLVEAYVAGHIARFSKQPPDNPFAQQGSHNPRYRAWNRGYFDADEVMLGEHALDAVRGKK